MVAAESAQRKADAATQLDAPLITFVMPCYNSAKFMRNGIESLLKIEQSCEIILINDGSSDNTGDIAQEYAESYQNVVAINQENSNWGGVVNHGIKLAKGIYFKVNFLTILGALPLAAGITYSVLSSSVLLLIPFSVIGGMLFGPFYAAFYNTLYRTFRDAPGRWFDSWKKSFRRNLRDSLLPGAFLGLGTGLFIFTGFLFYWSEKAPGFPTLMWFIVSAWLFMIILSLFWPQLILFSQPLSVTVRNMILFASKYLWKVLLVGALHIVVIIVYVLFAPWTIILVPILGFWYITFLN